MDAVPAATGSPRLRWRNLLRGPVGGDTRTGALLALGIFLLLLLSGRGQDLLPSPARMALVLAWPVVALAYVMSGRSVFVIAYCIGGGLVLRWVGFFPGGGSDVLPATYEAIRTLLGGGDPYTHFYVLERPPAAHFPYPPFEMFVHLPGYLLGGLTGVRFTEVAAATCVMGAFAWLAGRVSALTALPALALYAGLPNLINLSVDASNDTSTGAMLLLAILVAAWAAEQDFGPWTVEFAGIAAAFAAGTKQSVAPAIVLLAAFVWHRSGPRAVIRYVAAGAAAAAVASLPFLWLNAGAFVSQLTGVLRIHQDIYGWNLWVFAQSMGWPIPGVGAAADLVLGVTLVGTLGMLAFRYMRLAPAVAAGTIVIMASLLVARWTTYAYFATLAPIILLVPILLCWDELHPPCAEHTGTDPAGAG